MHATKTTLSQFVERAAAGEPVTIGAYGRAEVKLVAVDANERPRRRIGLLEGKLQLPDDLDVSLPDDVLRSFEGDADRSS